MRTDEVELDPKFVTELNHQRGLASGLMNEATSLRIEADKKQVAAFAIRAACDRLESAARDGGVLITKYTSETVLAARRGE